MRIKTFLLLAALMSAAALQAQIAVKIEPGRPLFMLYAAVYVYIAHGNIEYCSLKALS